MQLELDDFDHIKTYKADDRGRVTLGADYAGKEVKVVVVGVEDGDGE